MRVRNKLYSRVKTEESIPNIKALTEGYFLLIQIVGAERERKAIP
jgi:hypothetical protein